jgi:hypothetical protein
VTTNVYADLTNRNDNGWDRLRHKGSNRARRVFLREYRKPGSIKSCIFPRKRIQADRWDWATDFLKSLLDVDVSVYRDHDEPAVNVVVTCPNGRTISVRDDYVSYCPNDSDWMERWYDREWYGEGPGPNETAFKLADLALRQIDPADMRRALP